MWRRVWLPDVSLLAAVLFLLPAGCHSNLPVLNLLSASVAKNQHFAPVGETMRWIEK